jgi:broad specificity phosphatase PhoE
MPPKFLFVRHGEATHNAAFNVAKDQSVFLDKQFEDAPLTEEGVKQAQTTGKALFTYTLLDIWCSPLTRAIQTAEEIFEEANCGQLYLHDTLLERLGGGHICNQRKDKSVLKKHHGFWNLSFLPEFPPLWIERESTSAVCTRMLMLVLYLAELYKNAPESSHVVIVAHCDAIWCLTGKSLKNAEFIVLTLEEILNPKQKNAEQETISQGMESSPFTEHVGV